MKIAFCNILYTKKNDRGGLGAHIQDVSQELARIGHDVTILTSGTRKPYREGLVHIVELGNVPRFSQMRQLFNPFYWFLRLAYMWKLAVYVRKNDFDIVEAAEGGAEQLLLIFQHFCPIVTKLHGNFRHIYNRKVFARIVSFFESLATLKSDGIYTSSLSYAQTISSEYRIPMRRIRIIPYGIHVEELNTPADPTVKREGRKTVLLSVGSSPVRKGAMLFLDAASQLQNENIDFVLLSSEHAFDPSVQIPNNVIRLGNLNRGHFYSVLSAADIVVFPSQFESFGISAYEAMLCGKIVILSKNIPVEGTAQRYGRYFLLEHLESYRLAAAISDIFAGKITFPDSDPNIERQMKDEYDIRNVAAAVLSFYEETMVAAKAKMVRSAVDRSALASDQK